MKSVDDMSISEKFDTTAYWITKLMGFCELGSKERLQVCELIDWLEEEAAK